MTDYVHQDNHCLELTGLECINVPEHTSRLIWIYALDWKGGMKEEFISEGTNGLPRRSKGYYYNKSPSEAVCKKS